MKKSLFTLAILGLTSAGSFAQGYFLFAGSKNGTWDAFSSSGVSAVSSGTVNVGFLIGAANTSAPTLLSSANPTNNTSNVSWDGIAAALAGGFSWARNNTGGAVVEVPSNTAALTKGGWAYNGGTAFQVGNTVASTPYTVIPVAWAVTAGIDPTAVSSSTPVGWGNAFQYTSGTSLSTMPTFTASGALPFGVSPVPEPTSFALAGIGAAAMMIFRRKK